MNFTFMITLFKIFRSVTDLIRFGIVTFVAIYVMLMAEYMTSK